MNRIFYLLLTALLPALLLTACKERTYPEKTVEVHIILGQSNALGKADTYALPAELNEPLKGAHIYNKATGKFENIQAGVNTQSGRDEFGPLIRMAYLMQRHRNRDIYFIVAGAENSQLYNSGSKEVADWNPKSGELITEAKRTIENARTAIMSQGMKPKFLTVTWWQGENDALTEERAFAYLENERAFFASLDEVPYLSKTRRVVYKIFSEVGPYAQFVNQAKEERASSDPRTVALIDTRNYTRIPQDPINADTEGQLQAGFDLYMAIRDIR
ncbi:sialate O-acetylesterase [Pontibacter arcticus]|uniref:Sialate O-acetylesterase domain-containing protein n=1 Tax=Pontibacter arcticus TaxID=2080288 RepID=A0A364RCY4_9BACT|nr:sialate O-acetylesterase [Pontibacter arcticus]RAU82152.1 hypothetical protein DP923_10115 [Pontibacter arcticus]